MKPPIRHLLLSGICVGIGLTIGKLLIDPTTSQRQYSAIALPQTLPLTGAQLPGAQLLESQPISLNQPEAAETAKAETPKYDQILTGQQYQYQYKHQKQSFQLELRDVVNTGGNLHPLIQNRLNWGITPPPYQDVQTPIGFYRRFTQQGNAYLVSCLSPTGYSFVTPAQFRSQLYQQLWQPNQLLGWVIGQNSLLEKRCLWIQLSTPMQAAASEDSHTDHSDAIKNIDDNTARQLEEQWRSIVAWWMSYYQ